MRQGSAAIRLLAGFALALALTAAIAPFAGSRAVAQDNGLASITLYTTVCPDGFTGDDFFGECYDDPLPNWQYFLTGPAIDGTAVAESGTDGLAAFEGIDVDGQYALRPQLPLAFERIEIFCSEGGEPFPIEYSEDLGAYALDLTTSDDLRCDVYFVLRDQDRAGANLTIHNRVCPAGYDGTDFYNVCHDTPAGGQVFFLNSTDGPQETTDAAGNLTFADLAADTYFVFGGPPGDFIDYTAIFCAPTAAPGTPFPFSQEDGDAAFTIALTEGDDVTCDFYSVPVDQGAPGETASVTIYKAICPAGYDDDDYFDDCFDNPGAGIRFSLSIPGPNASGDVATTDANGFAAFEGLGAAEFLLEEEIPGEFNDFVVFCSKDGQAFPFAYATNANGILLDLTTDDDLRCDWYNIPEDLSGKTPTPQPTAKPTQPVTQLPSTGAGADETGGGLAGLVALVLLVTAGGAVWAGRRRVRQAPR